MMRGQRAASAFRYCWVVVLVGLVAVSCADDSSAGDREDREEMLTVLRQEIVEALPEASPTQQEILADFHVSPGEADRAAAEVVDCARAQGVAVKPIRHDSGGMGFETVVGGPGDEQEDMDAAYAVYEDCHNSLFWLTENALALQNALSSEELKRRDGLVLDCLVAAGFDVGSWPDVQSEPDPSVESDCVDSAMSKLGLGN